MIYIDLMRNQNMIHLAVQENESDAKTKGKLPSFFFLLLPQTKPSQIQAVKFNVLDLLKKCKRLLQFLIFLFLGSLISRWQIQSCKTNQKADSLFLLPAPGNHKKHLDFEKHMQSVRGNCLLLSWYLSEATKMGSACFANKKNQL